VKAKRHHYVPEWYQRRFIPPGAKDNNLWYLDLSPEPIAHPGGFHTPKDLRRRGPDVCFYEDNLYRLHFGNLASDVVEHRFFGEIDRTGSVAVDAMSDFQFGKVSGSHMQPLVNYLDAQKLRTPKGLDVLKETTGTADHEASVMWMGRLSQMHCTMWMEGIWEIFQCSHTPTKLIISDHPVTTYNRQLPPTAQECRYPNDAGIDLLGTQTLVPLRPDRLLVITNLGFARNHWANGKVQRVNPRSFGTTMMFLGNIHTGRKINEGEVRSVNYIIKQRARKFIAAGEKEWLYPENNVKTKVWHELGGELFLRPDPRRVGFSGEMYVGYKDGSSWGIDEYGRPPVDDERRKAQRAIEWEYYVKSTNLWDRKCGKPPRAAGGGMVL
jgi:hypothetical protein